MEDVVVGDGKVGKEMGNDVRVMVWWFRRPEAVWGCNCEMEVSGEISNHFNSTLLRNVEKAEFKPFVMNS